ncbi:Oidioi.mRNA.OKI2018_I69.PAR.g12015.t1.cds [Oikopleura dioica]|uniref:Oidioi.mRNA.OKI2018_I69.PAR.g12015.t1.cds n=1 Tax=Oikopleura dioica TaxID=34765 RepID=A0ABN7S1K3_OIKDI|nr:Oidioi.mRNA.OKI2018_I69.PAR.g12015.t1.cds [Oikopleura dioica]
MLGGKRLLSVFLALAFGKKTFESSKSQIQDLKKKTVKWCSEYMPERFSGDELHKKTCSNRFNKFYASPENCKVTSENPQPRARKRYRKNFDLDDGPSILAKFGRRTNRFIIQEMDGCKRGPMYKKIFTNVIERFRNKQKIIRRRQDRLAKKQD